MAFNLSNPIGTGTDQELLDFVRAAIAQILLHGQAYSIDGRQYTRADLATLEKLEQKYEARVNAAAGASRSKENLARFKRPV